MRGTSVRSLAGAVVVWVAACGPAHTGTGDGGASDGGSHECHVTAPTSCPSPAPRYADVEPILTARCVTCHGDVDGGPWPLSDYEHVSDWRDDIRADLLSCSMPPPDAGSDMTNEERLTILNWLRCGMPK